MSADPSQETDRSTDRETNRETGRTGNDDGGRVDRGMDRGEFLRVWGPVIVLAVIALAYTFSKLEPPAPEHLTLAAGSPGGAYFTFAEEYREILGREGFELELVETAGGQENLRLLRDGEVDLAILQGGLAADADVGADVEGALPEDDDESGGPRSLGSVFFEPVWVFHRAELEVGRLGDLAGRRVAVGAEGSGTRVLARQLLSENGVESGAEDGVQIVGPPFPQAADALVAGEIDAAFFVASAEAPYVRRLLAEPGVKLLPFRRARAYQIRHPFLSRVVLGEGALDLETNLPPRDVPLVAAAASIGARPDLHHALTPLLVEAMTEVHGGGGLFTDPGTFPTARWTDLPMQTEAAHYLENGPSFLYRYLPYRTAASMDRLKILLLPFVPLLLVVFKMAPPLYRWRIRSKIYRWYDDLRQIDRFLLDEPHPQSDAERIDEHLDRVRDLDRELSAEVSVPLSYMDELYSLRLHVGLIEEKLEELAAERDAGDGTAPG